MGVMVLVRLHEHVMDYVASHCGVRHGFVEEDDLPDTDTSTLSRSGPKLPTLRSGSSETFVSHSSVGPT